MQTSPKVNLRVSLCDLSPNLSESRTRIRQVKLDNRKKRRQKDPGVRKVFSFKTQSLFYKMKLGMEVKLWSRFGSGWLHETKTDFLRKPMISKASSFGFLRKNNQTAF